jgi:hypothetical protein
MMPVPELANFRQKYPDYNDLSDADLAGMLAKKYPESYGDLPAKVGTGSSVAPNSLAADPMNMTGAERKKWAREREKFTANTGTLGTQIRQNLFDPNQEYVTDEPVAALTKSLGNTVGSIVSMPKDIYKKFQTALDPNSADNQKARQYDDNTTLQDLAMIGREAGGAVQDLGAPVGLRGVEGLKESWGKAPVQSLATVGLVKPLIGRGVKGAVAGAADMAGRTADLASSRLMDMTLKQGTTLKTAKRQQNVQTALEGGYIPNKKGVDKLSADISATEKALGDGIAAGDAAQVRGTLDKAISNVEALREEAKRSADPAKYNAMIDAEIEKLRTHPVLEGGPEPLQSFKEFSTGKMGPYMKSEGGHGPAMQRISKEYNEYKANAPREQTGTVDIGTLQKMKVEQGRAVKYQTKTGQAPDPFQASIDKARIRGMKEELETQLFDVFPELKTTNQKLSNYYGLQDVLERAANRIEQNQGVGIALPIKSGSGAAIGGMLGGPAGAAVGGGIGAMIGIIEHPSVAPRLARAIFNARKGKISPERARGIVDERLSGIVKRLKDEKEQHQ